MIVKSITRISLHATDVGQIYPILPVKVGLVFPGHTRRYHINRKSSQILVDRAIKGKKPLIISFSPTPRELVDGATIPISEVGVTARVVSSRELKGGARDVEFEALALVAVISLVEGQPYLQGEGRLIEIGAGPTGAKRDALVGGIIELCDKISSRNPDVDSKLKDIVHIKHENDGAFADSITTCAPLSPSERQALLETVEVRTRLELLSDLLQRELDRAQLEIQLGHIAEKELEESRRREFLELKLEEIKKQLGGPYAEERASTSLKRRINLATNLPSEIRELAWEETQRLAILPIGAAEYASVKHYVETLLSLPWPQGEETEPPDLDRLKERVYKDYFGSESSKARIVERISSIILSAGTEKGSVTCFVGPTGTGKATLARSIAAGLGREFVRVSVGAVVDQMEIKGSNRIHIGAAPGLFIKAMQKLERPDPVFFVEDLEYLNEGGDSSLALALLEIMDPRLNRRFTDNYLGAPFDFSKAIFICSMRYPDGMPEAMEHRMEMIEIPGYIEKEKISIARKRLIPSLLKDYKLGRNEIKYTSEALISIIQDYTMESGLMEFSRVLDRLFRHIVSEKRSGKRKSWKLDKSLIESVLGAPIYIPEKPVKEPEIGVAIGLAWTGAGGEIMLIECLKMRGDGNILFTGSLGEVMKESIQAAHSYIRSKADMLGIDPDDFKNFDIHVHFPSGAIPKDGPSAGVAVSLVIASVMAERPIRNDMAMTGEVSLRGKVLPVGGIKEKIAAAHRVHLATVCLPRENEKDLKDLPREITRNTKFIFVDSVDELFEQALLDFTPSAHTLEKLFAVELEKARRKRDQRTRSIRKKSSRSRAASPTKSSTRKKKSR